MQLRRKATQKKGATTEPRTRDLHSNVEFHPRELQNRNSTVIPLFVKTEFEWQPYCRTCWPFCLPSQAPECISIQMTLLSITRCFCYGLCHYVWHKLSAKTPKDRHVMD